MALVAGKDLDLPAGAAKRYERDTGPPLYAGWNSTVYAGIALRDADGDDKCRADAKSPRAVGRSPRGKPSDERLVVTGGSIEPAHDVSAESLGGHASSPRTDTLRAFFPRARAHTRGLRVALKVVSKVDLHDDSGDGHSLGGPTAAASRCSELDRAMNEAALHKMVTPCRFIIPLLDTIEDAASVLHVMPLAPGGDLWGRMQYCENLSEVQARRLVRMLADALSHLHACGVVHCDVKPQNVLLFDAVDVTSHSDGGGGAASRPRGSSDAPVGSAGRPCLALLADFGLAEHLDSNGAVPFTGLRGTTGYFAPELITRAPSFSGKIDVFALGVITYRAVCGYEPFFPPTAFMDEPDFEERYWGHVTVECKDLLRSMLRLDPQERLSAGEVLAHKWFDTPVAPASGADTPIYFLGDEKEP